VGGTVALSHPKEFAFMRCPHCGGPSLHGELVRQDVLVEVCSECHGLWLDRGQIGEFTARPEVLEAQLAGGLRDRQPAGRPCPRCDAALERGRLPDRDAHVDECPACGGLWFDADELDRALRAGPGETGLQLPDEQALAEPVAEVDPEATAKAHERHQGLAVGLLALPNLFLRSVVVLGLLYGILGLVLITLVQFHFLGPGLALVIGVTIAVLQFALGPWIMDLTLRWINDFRWVRPDELPEHLRAFVEKVCAQERMKLPSFGLIRDGAPTAFTYGHHPSNARVVISRGILELLEPAEVEAVVAHELGHARNWDMALMTVANLVPLLLFYLYRVGIEFTELKGDDNKTGWAAWGITIGSYVLYVVSEFIVLWFSRTREYYADRFSGQATGNPNALASALVKIAYGLAAQGEPAGAAKGKEKEKVVAGAGALGALNISERKGSVGLVMASAVGTEAGSAQLDPERVKGAMQWDLWNPWATFYELSSTHPLVTHRLQYLADQAAHQGQDPFVVFDRRKPRSYWDDFAVDLGVMILPWVCFLAGAAAAALTWQPVGLALGLALAGVGSLLKTAFVYRRDFFPHVSVAALLHKVRVSAVRPVPATLTGTIIGKGVPGLVWSEDFVLHDRTGILFLDYRQPLAIWNFLFGLFRAGQYQGKEVRVSGWFRRSPVPYLEVNQVEVLDGSLPSRRCYSYHARLGVAVVMMALGVFLAALLMLRGGLQLLG
jgi:Zn-dependent protease with chaperone function/Zn-finger nucleic acid-binding protein